VNDAAVERIESRIAFLERANQELSDVVLRQEREIGVLREKVTALAARVAAASDEQSEYSPEQERPPHY
jgi:SlyX protein